MSEVKFFKEEDLQKFIEKRGSIDMHDMKDLVVGNIIPYYISGGCALLTISCQGVFIYPDPKLYTIKNEVL